jgi:hypothetical protein
MTEAEWLAATDPEPMLAALWIAGKVSDRKLRLFAAACCRGIWSLMNDERSRKGVKFAERYADGRAGKEELAAAGDGTASAWWDGCEDDRMHAGWSARAACFCCTGGVDLLRHVPDTTRTAIRTAVPAGAGREAAEDAASAEALRQAARLRDVFGPLPFREVRVEPAWLAWNAGTVKRLAVSAYEERDLPAGRLENARLGVLADALEEAGCSNMEILGHLREQGGVHVRGCWVVDLLLGKE